MGQAPLQAGKSPPHCVAGVGRGLRHWQRPSRMPHAAPDTHVPPQTWPDCPQGSSGLRQYHMAVAWERHDEKKSPGNFTVSRT